MIWVMSFHYWLERCIILFFACDIEFHVIGPFPCWLLNSTIHLPRGFKPFSTSKIWEQMIWLYILNSQCIHCIKILMTGIHQDLTKNHNITIYIKTRKMLMCFRNIWNINISIRFINHRTTFIVSMLCSY